MVHHEQMETIIDLEEKTEKEIRKKLRKQALIFSLIYGFVWLVQWVLYVKFDYKHIKVGEPLGLVQVLFFKIVTAIWISRYAKKLELEVFTWVIFCLFSPILTMFLIGISKDKETHNEY